MRWPGIEPGSTAWKAAMLTIIPPSLNENHRTKLIFYFQYLFKQNYDLRD